MSEEILIITGPVRTGKTTRLLNWLSDKENVYGIATPVIENKKYFFDLHEKQYFPMEADPNENEILQIGKYTFSKNFFKKAESVIENGMKHSQFLVIDEVGPLELKEEGFCSVLRKIIKTENNNFRSLIVVRDNKLSEILNYFGIDKYEILDI